MGIFHEDYPIATFQAGLGTAGGFAAITAAPLALSAAGSQLIFALIEYRYSLSPVSYRGQKAIEDNLEHPE